MKSKALLVLALFSFVFIFSGCPSETQEEEAVKEPVKEEVKAPEVKAPEAVAPEAVAPEDAQKCQKDVGELTKWLAGLAAAPDKVGPPPASAIDGNLAEIAKLKKDEKKAPKYAELADPIFANCAPAKAVFDTVAQTPPDQKANVFAQTLPTAITLCKCDLNLTDAKALLYAILKKPAEKAEPVDCKKASKKFSKWLAKLAKKPDKATPPEASSIDDKLKAIMKKGKKGAKQLAKLSETLIAECPDAKEVFEKAAKAKPDKKAGVYSKGLPKAIRKCECKVDMDAMKALLWALIKGEGPKEQAAAEEAGGQQ